MFSSFLGLPLHPLAVHVPVILLPVSAVALVLAIVIRPWRRPLATPSVVGLGVGAVGAFVARASGEAFEAQVGDPGSHARYGNLLFLLAAVTFVVSAVWWWLERRTRNGGTTSLLVAFIGGLAALLAVASIVLTVVVGHTGATAAWGDRTGPAPTPAAAGAPSASSSTGGTATGTASGYTMAQVADHSSSSSCWTAIDGTVYDVTSWINQHPGGADKILGLCGKDGTTQFTNQHGGEARPASELATFKIGQLQK